MTARPGAAISSRLDAAKAPGVYFVVMEPNGPELARTWHGSGQVRAMVGRIPGAGSSGQAARL